VTRSRTRTLRRAVVLAVGVVAVDQAVKAVVRTTLDLGERREVLPFLDVVHVRNTGVAFGFLADGGALLIAGTGVALVALMAFVLSHSDRPYVWVPAGLLLGGAAGNLLDRLREGYVEHFYGKDASRPELYHLVVDTVRLGWACAEEIIVTAANRYAS